MSLVWIVEDQLGLRIEIMYICGLVTEKVKVNIRHRWGLHILALLSFSAKNTLLMYLMYVEVHAIGADKCILYRRNYITHMRYLYLPIQYSLAKPMKGRKL